MLCIAMAGNKEVVKFIHNEIQKALDKELSSLRDNDKEFQALSRDLKQRIGSIEDSIVSMRSLVSSLELSLNKKIQFVSDQSKSTTQKSDQQLVIIKDQIELAVAKKLDEDIKPQIENMRRHFAEKTLDGTQLVTEFRQKVHAQSKSLAIASGDESANFQSMLFAFTDQD